MNYSKLSVTAQTAFAQLMESALAIEHAHTVADLSGSFSTKTVKGHRYVYFQYREPSGDLHQVFLGPDNAQTRALMASSKAPGATAALGPLAGSAVALGCAPVVSSQLKIIKRLAEYGFFRAGGVLIGTHAYLAYGNLLGVKWREASATQDIDFAHAGKRVSIALPTNLTLEVHDAIGSLNMGLLPISALSGKSGARYLNPSDPALKLDFLSPRHVDDAPYEHAQLGVALQPLKFMEYLLEGVQRSVIFSARDAVAVTVPDPVRYALHKLLVYGERSGSDIVKTSKDLSQSAALLRFFLDERPWEIAPLWEDLVSRGKKWVRRAHQGVHALNRAYPDLAILDALGVTQKDIDRSIKGADIDLDA